ncbi:ATP-binding protein [Nocardia callitridis]
MFRARLGVRARILAIALIPSLTLLVVGVSAAGYLMSEASTAKQWAATNQTWIPLAREVLESVQQERELTLARLSGDTSVTAELTDARGRLDSALPALGDVGPSKLGDQSEDFAAALGQIATIRSGVDAKTTPVADAYAYYNRVLDLIASASALAERTAPDARSAATIAASNRLFHVAEAMSRANALGVVFSGTGNAPSALPAEEYLRQIGYYHTEIRTLTTEFGDPDDEHLRAVAESPAFQRLTAMENALARRAVLSTSGVRTPNPPPLPMNPAEWHATAQTVSNGLIDLWADHSGASQRAAQSSAADSTARSAYGGFGVLAVSVLAFLIAVVLANRVIRRLKRLRGQTLRLADERLPEMMRRLHEGETIDPAAESATLDYGRDEIGQVAKAFQHAHTAAVEAALAEARTRRGVNAVFLNIAHRSQIVVHRQLEILDKAEQQQEDPALLDIFFRLDHLATRERRNAENLTILGGGRPGRQWRSPVPLVDVLRSAVGETAEYARVRVARMPEVRVAGTIVADLVHLLAELVDNATSFSPPQARVEVGGSVVGTGIVAEIIDQGVGMSALELERANEMLRNPPDFGVAALSADSRLGLFVVARLATRNGVSVRLSESDFGGVRAVVRIPSALVADDTDQPPSAHAMPDRKAPAATSPTHRSSIDRVGAAKPFPPATGAPNGRTETPPTPPTPPTSTPPNGESRPHREGTKPALPRRTRQANHPAGPQDSNSTAADSGAAQPTRERQARSPEQARDLMAAIETGTRQGRRPLRENDSGAAPSANIRSEEES